LALVENVLSAIILSDGSDEGDRQALTTLVTTLRLENGVQFFSDRVSQTMQWNLGRSVKDGKFSRNLGEILQASGRNAAEEFDSSNQAHLDKLNDDISNTQSVTQQNIENFTELYAGGFSEVLTRLKSAADRAGEPLEGAKRPNRRVQSRICLLLASTASEWPSNIDPALCRDTMIDSIYNGYQEKIFFQELKHRLDMREPLETRICTYRDFLRRTATFGTSKPLAELLLEIQTR